MVVFKQVQCLLDLITVEVDVFEARCDLSVRVGHTLVSDCIEATFDVELALEQSHRTAGQPKRTAAIEGVGHVDACRVVVRGLHLLSSHYHYIRGSHASGVIPVS